MRVFIVYCILINIVLFSCKRENKELVLNYDDGTVRIKAPIDSDSLAHGEVIYYYPSGQKEFKYQYVHGKKNGEYLSYYLSGNLKEKGYYVKNNRHGKLIEYYDSNNLVVKSESYFENGQENGMYYFFKKNGDTSSLGYVEMDTTRFFVEYDESGEIADSYSESAILPEEILINEYSPFTVRFKVYGDETEIVDVNYLLINFENDDTIKNSTIEKYRFNLIEPIRFEGLRKGRYFIDFYVPMLDTTIIMTTPIRVAHE